MQPRLQATIRGATMRGLIETTNANVLKGTTRTAATLVCNEPVGTTVVDARFAPSTAREADSAVEAMHVARCGGSAWQVTLADGQPKEVSVAMLRAALWIPNGIAFVCNTLRKLDDSTTTLPTSALVDVANELIRLRRLFWTLYPNLPESQRPLQQHVHNCIAGLRLNTKSGLDNDDGQAYVYFHTLLFTTVNKLAGRALNSLSGSNDGRGRAGPGVVVANGCEHDILVLGKKLIHGGYMDDLRAQHHEDLCEADCDSGLRSLSGTTLGECPNALLLGIRSQEALRDALYNRVAQLDAAVDPTDARCALRVGRLLAPFLFRLAKNVNHLMLTNPKGWARFALPQWAPTVSIPAMLFFSDNGMFAWLCSILRCLLGSQEQGMPTVAPHTPHMALVQLITKMLTLDRLCEPSDEEIAALPDELRDLRGRRFVRLLLLASQLRSGIKESEPVRVGEKGMLYLRVSTAFKAGTQPSDALWQAVSFYRHPQRALVHLLTHAAFGTKNAALFCAPDANSELYVQSGVDHDLLNGPLPSVRTPTLALPEPLPLPPAARAALLSVLLESGMVPFIDVDTHGLASDRRHEVLGCLRLVYTLINNAPTIGERTLKQWLSTLLVDFVVSPRQKLSIDADKEVQNGWSPSVHLERVRLAIHLVLGYAKYAHNDVLTSPRGEIPTKPNQACVNLLYGLVWVSNVLIRRIGTGWTSHQIDALTPALFVVERSGSISIGSGSLESHQPMKRAPAFGIAGAYRWDKEWAWAVRVVLETTLFHDETVWEAVRSTDPAQREHAFRYVMLVRHSGVAVALRGGIGGYSPKGVPRSATEVADDDEHRRAGAKYVKGMRKVDVHWLAQLVYDCPSVLENAISVLERHAAVPPHFRRWNLDLTKPNLWMRLKNTARHDLQWAVLGDLWAMLVAESRLGDWSAVEYMLKHCSDDTPYLMCAGFPFESHYLGPASDAAKHRATFYKPLRHDASKGGVDAGKIRRANACARPPELQESSMLRRLQAEQVGAAEAMKRCLVGPGAGEAKQAHTDAQDAVQAWKVTHLKAQAIAKQAVNDSAGERAPRESEVVAEYLVNRYRPALHHLMHLSLHDPNPTLARITNPVVIRRDVALCTEWLSPSVRLGLGLGDGEPRPRLPTPTDPNADTLTVGALLVAMCPSAYLSSTHEAVRQLTWAVEGALDSCADGKLPNDALSAKGHLPRWLSGVVVDDIQAKRPVDEFRRGTDAEVARMLHIREMFQTAVRLRSRSAVNAILDASKLDRCAMNPFEAGCPLLSSGVAHGRILSPELGLTAASACVLLNNCDRADQLAMYLLQDIARDQCPAVLPPLPAQRQEVSAAERARKRKHATTLVDLTGTDDDGVEMQWYTGGGGASTSASASASASASTSASADVKPPVDKAPRTEPPAPPAPPPAAAPAPPPVALRVRARLTWRDLPVPAPAPAPAAPPAPARAPAAPPAAAAPTPAETWANKALEHLLNTNTLIGLPGRAPFLAAPRFVHPLPGYYFGRDFQSGAVGYFVDHGFASVTQRPDHRVTMHAATTLINTAVSPAQFCPPGGTIPRVQGPMRNPAVPRPSQVQAGGRPSGLTELVRGGGGGGGASGAPRGP